MKKGSKALAIISLVLFTGALAFVAYQLFQVRQITVTGCETRGTDEIIALSGLELDTSIFKVDRQAVMDGIAGDAYLKPVGVEIKYPDNVVIAVEERKEAAVIEKDNAYVVIDREGWVLRFATDYGEAPYPLVDGIGADTALVGRQIGTKDSFKIGELTRLLDAFASHGIEPERIDVSLAADVVLTLFGGLTVELGDDTQLDEKIALIEASRSEIAKMEKTGGILDVSSVKKAYYREN